MQCAKDVETNIQTAERLVRQLQNKAHKLFSCLKLFERPYFCQERQYDYYQHAQSRSSENTAIQHFKVIAKELQVVLPISFYEKMAMSYITSIAVIDADGEVLGVYRKDPYQTTITIKRNFILRPAIQVSWSGIRAMLRLGSVSFGINGSLKQRCLALNGAELLLLSNCYWLLEPILDTDSCGHWQRTMQGHAAANIVPVIAANRYGLEEVTQVRKMADRVLVSWLLRFILYDG